MPSTYPKCRWCGHEFRFRFNFFDSTSDEIHLEDQCSNAHTYGGEYTRNATCPKCGNPCEIGYKCVMNAVSRKGRKEGGDD